MMNWRCLALNECNASKTYHKQQCKSACNLLDWMGLQWIFKKVVPSKRLDCQQKIFWMFYNNIVAFISLIERGWPHSSATQTQQDVSGSGPRWCHQSRSGTNSAYTLGRLTHATSAIALGHYKFAGALAQRHIVQDERHLLPQLGRCLQTECSRQTRAFPVSCHIAPRLHPPEKKTSENPLSNLKHTLTEASKVRGLSLEQGHLKLTLRQRPQGELGQGQGQQPGPLCGPASPCRQPAVPPGPAQLGQLLLTG